MPETSQKKVSYFFSKNFNRPRLYFFLILSLMITFLVALYLPLPTAQMSLASDVHDANGRLISTFYLQNRRPQKIDETPDFLIKAFLAVEDHRFFQHHGINPGRILKAAWYDLIHRRFAQGASTITQQLAKNAYLSPRRTFSRKLKELFYTLKLELHLPKEKILELYLNQIYFGHGAYGLKVAAETYFQKDLSRLNQAEMALLAGLPKSPAYYSPYTHPRAAQKRLTQTLRRMLACRFISLAEYQIYRKQPLSLPGIKTWKRAAPYFLDLLQDEINAVFPKDPGILYTGGLIIESTLDLDLQLKAERSLAKGLPRLLKDHNGLVQPQGVLIAAEPGSGEIKALIGGSDFEKSQFNRATQAKRQPGSAFKPILYAAALSNGYTLADRFDRAPKTYYVGAVPYRPTDNRKSELSGSISLRRALAASSNVVAVKLLEAVGLKTVLDFAARMGITSKLPPLLPLALGSGEVTPLELTAAYLPLANGGYAIRPTTIRRILDRNRKVIYRSIPERKPVLNPGTAFLVTRALRGVFEKDGTASNIGSYLNFPAAGKTGTTENNRDAWFLGYTPELLTCVYVGCDHYEHSLPGAANRIAAPIWADFVAQVFEKKPPVEFAVPAEVVSVSICRDTGARATPFCPSESEYFLAGTEPKNYCPVHRFLKIKICKRSQLLPGPYCRHLTEKLFPLGEQPTTVCDRCGPKLKIFEWFRKIFQTKTKN